MTAPDAPPARCPGCEGTPHKHPIRLTSPDVAPGWSCHVSTDDMRPEYDFSSGIRGKYLDRYRSAPPSGLMCGRDYSNHPGVSGPSRAARSVKVAPAPVCSCRHLPDALCGCRCHKTPPAPINATNKKEKEKSMKKSVNATKASDKGLVALLGKRVTLFCLNYIYTGKLTGVNDACVLLEDAAIVYETGPLMDKKWQDAQTLPGPWYVQIGAIESFGVLKG